MYDLHGENVWRGVGGARQEGDPHVGRTRDFAHVGIGRGPGRGLHLWVGEGGRAEVKEGGPPVKRFEEVWGLNRQTDRHDWKYYLEYHVAGGNNAVTPTLRQTYLKLIPHTTCKRSCGKAMFSHLCHSVHGEGGVHSLGKHPLGTHPPS